MEKYRDGIVSSHVEVRLINYVLRNRQLTGGQHGNVSGVAIKGVLDSGVHVGAGAGGVPLPREARKVLLFITSTLKYG